MRIIQRGVNCLPRVNYLVRSATVHIVKIARGFIARGTEPTDTREALFTPPPRAAICPLTNGPDVRGLPFVGFIDFSGGRWKKCRAKWLRDGERGGKSGDSNYGVKRDLFTITFPSKLFISNMISRTTPIISIPYSLHVIIANWRR